MIATFEHKDLLHLKQMPKVNISIELSEEETQALSTNPESLAAFLAHLQALKIPSSTETASTVPSATPTSSPAPAPSTTPTVCDILGIFKPLVLAAVGEAGTKIKKEIDNQVVIETLVNLLKK